LDGEKKMNSNGRQRPQMPDVAGSVSGLTHDVIELTELQAQLFLLDLKKSSQKTRTCVILAIIGVCLLLASLPVALFALAELLVEQLEWSPSAGLGVATLVGLLLSAIFAGAAYSIVRSGLVSLERSRDEFNRNIAWIKSTLRNRGQYGAFTKS
jgi:Putative Actinobacterial Holin-X, holin superfamily III